MHAANGLDVEKVTQLFEWREIIATNEQTYVRMSGTNTLELDPETRAHEYRSFL